MEITPTSVELIPSSVSMVRVADFVGLGCLPFLRKIHSTEYMQVVDLLDQKNTCRYGMSLLLTGLAKIRLYKRNDS